MLTTSEMQLCNSLLPISLDSTSNKLFPYLVLIFFSYTILSFNMGIVCYSWTYSYQITDAATIEVNTLKAERFKSMLGTMNYQRARHILQVHTTATKRM